MKDPKFEVSKLDQVGSSYIATYGHSEFSEIESNVTNIPVAAFTTSYGRIKLYRLMDTLQNRLLYCDTDSVIFVERPGDQPPPTGEFLGDLTDELKDAYGEDAYGFEFCAPGPKSYALNVYTAQGLETILRAKGLTLSSETSHLVNFERMRQLVKNDEPFDIEEEDEDDMGGSNNNNDVANDDGRGDILNDLPDEADIRGNEPVEAEDVLDEEEIRVPYRGFRPGEHGGVTEVQGDKKFRKTYRKRYQIPGTTMTKPFGYTGILPL